MSEPYPTMRGHFFYNLHKLMQENEDVVVITGDLGHGYLDKIKGEFPDRFHNVGAAEQAMMGIAVGLALEGKIPIVYSITNFLLYRPFETIRNYINHERIPVIMAGGGRDKDYSHDGFSHWSEDAGRVLDIFPMILEYWPKEKEEVTLEYLREIINNKVPSFISLRR